jgi:L-ascorbate metabolism protein UlaG (beta-lactamase superfamily)
MKITWRGDSCFEIASVNKEKDNVLTVIDPLESEKKGGKISGDVILKSHVFDSDGLKINEQFIVSSCGEYERKGIFIQGIPSLQPDKKKNIIYVIEAEEIRICHLGYFGGEDLNDEQLTELGNIDILIVPVDGDRTVTYKEAAKIVSRVEPIMVIPMCYDPDKKEKGLEPFLKAMGAKDIVSQEKLSILKKNISTESEKTEIVILERK